MSGSPQNRLRNHLLRAEGRLTTAGDPEGTLKYWRKVQMYATAYCPATSGRLAALRVWPDETGQQLRKGLVAVDPKVIPLARACMFWLWRGSGIRHWRRRARAHDRPGLRGQQLSVVALVGGRIYPGSALFPPPSRGFCPSTRREIPVPAQVAKVSCRGALPASTAPAFGAASEQCYTWLLHMVHSHVTFVARSWQIYHPDPGRS